MTRITYSTRGTTAVVMMQGGENRFNPAFLDEFLNVLDAVEQETEATALVVNSSHEKVFCNGIDLGWFIPILESGDTDAIKRFYYQMHGLFRRLLLSPLLTIAAINGHAFAAGAVLCCAFDFRFMRGDRGFFCLPEVDLGVPLTPSAISLCKKAMPGHVFNEMLFTGKRLTGQDCRDAHIVSEACPEDELMDTALEFANRLNKRREIVREMKARSNRDIVRLIDEEDPAVIEKGEFKLF